VECPRTRGICPAELPQDERQFHRRIGEATVLPIDQAEAAGSGRAQVVGPEVPVAGAGRSRGHDEGVERYERVASSREPFGERGAGDP
jgi:hypothetical protein